MSNVFLLKKRGPPRSTRTDTLLPYTTLVRSEETVKLAMWREGLKMDDPEVFVAALDAAGRPGAEIAAKCQDPAIKAELVANTERAVARGAFGAPTFFVGDEIFFGKDRLDDVIEAARP